MVLDTNNPEHRKLSIASMESHFLDYFYKKVYLSFVLEDKYLKFVQTIVYCYAISTLFLFTLSNFNEK